MTDASVKALAKAGVSVDGTDLAVPHQASSCIIESVAKYVGIPWSKVQPTVQKHGNMSAATVPVALVEALEANRIKPHAKLPMPAFGVGLTVCSHHGEWGDRITPIDVSDIELAPRDKTALELMNKIRVVKDIHGRIAAGPVAAYYVDKQPYGAQ